MNFLDNLYNRRKKLADVLADKEYSGIRQIVEELYPDRAHFIYELLQNAEDVGASEAKFILETDRLVFEHDGRPFNDEDVAGITNIGKGTKADQEDKIGRFGIGFKAVFAYSETPHIWSPTYAFKITDLVLPVAIPENRQIDQKTRFEFPFDSPKKQSEDAYEQIKIGLDELAETTLLFLSSLESISWQIGQQASGEVLRIEHSNHHVEILKQTNGKVDSSAHFLRFLDTVEGLKKQHLAIAFELNFLPNIIVFDAHESLANQLQIVAANPGRVAVSFPAKKENSGLRFHIHAPFVPELSRASIKETPANIFLFEQLTQLAASSLHTIRDLKLLSGGFLNVLPNSKDPIPARYRLIRNAIINEMNNEWLTPTHAKSHAPAKHLFQAKASLKTLLSEEDLECLIEYDDELDWNDKLPQWAIGSSQKNSLQDRFLSGLEITAWDVEDFVELLKEKAGSNWSDPDPNFMAWYAAKPDEWYQQMYALLYREYDELYSLEDIQIVRLSNGNYSVGSKCFFPSDGIDNDEVLPRIAKDIYSSGKSKAQQEHARKFLEEIGVREVGETDQVKAILKQRYTNDAKAPGEKTYRKDLNRFITLVEKEPASAKLFADYHIFELADGKWGKPSQAYLDLPFLDTELSAYYETLGNDAKRAALSQSYRDCGVLVEKLTKFSEDTGVESSLTIKKESTLNHPLKDNLREDYYKKYIKLTDTAINTDWMIPNLERLLNKPSIPISKLVWKTMMGSCYQVLKARFRPNQNHQIREEPSSLVLLLRRTPWIPQGNDEFVIPKHASSGQLPEGFPFDSGEKWLEAINFGMAAKKLSEEYRIRNNQAQKIGFESADEAKKYAELAKLFKKHGKSPDELIMQLKPGLSNSKPIFPTKTVSNPERRQTKFLEQLDNTPEKKSKPCIRRVRVTRATEYTRVWLRNQYTNEDDQMICQVCKDKMPFRKRDGKHYFEAVEALARDHFTKEHEAQFLALCPECAAMYKEFIKRDEGAMKDMKNKLRNMEDCEIPLSLGELDTSIRFIETHCHDIKIILDDQ